MKVSIASLRRRLAVGTEYTAEFVGRNANAMPDDKRISRRKVVNQGIGRMVSAILTGPNAHELIWLEWPGVTADEANGVVTLTQRGGPFVKITV